VGWPTSALEIKTRPAGNCSTRPPLAAFPTRPEREPWRSLLGCSPSPLGLPTRTCRSAPCRRCLASRELKKVPAPGFGQARSKAGARRGAPYNAPVVCDNTPRRRAVNYLASRKPRARRRKQKGRPESRPLPVPLRTGAPQGDATDFAVQSRPKDLQRGGCIKMTPRINAVNSRRGFRARALMTGQTKRAADARRLQVAPATRSWLIRRPVQWPSAAFAAGPTRPQQKKPRAGGHGAISALGWGARIARCAIQLDWRGIVPGILRSAMRRDTALRIWTSQPSRPACSMRTGREVPPKSGGEGRKMTDA
jgi:hypothetical protein